MPAEPKILYAGRCRAEIHMMPSGRWIGHVFIPTNPGESFDVYASEEPTGISTAIKFAYPQVKIAPICEECLTGAAARGQSIPKELH